MHTILAISIATSLLMPVDTPPAPPAIASIEKMQSEADVVALAKLGDGRKAPANLRLPRTANGPEVFKYLVDNYPRIHRAGDGPPQVGLVWMRVSEKGVVTEVSVLKTTGAAVFDSLALAALKVFRFTPAELEANAVAVWVAFPLQIGSYQQLSARLKREENSDANAPYFTSYTSKPELINRADVQRELVRRYPKELRDNGVGGTTVVWLYIDRDGNTVRMQVKQTSGRRKIDDAALQVASVMKWTPALNKAERVPVWIALPIVFNTK